MFRTVFSLLGFLSALPLHTQDGIAAGSEDRAAELRQLLRDRPRLPLEPVPLASRLLRAAALGNSDPTDSVQLIDSTKRHYHQKQLIRPSEVHAGYTVVPEVSRKAPQVERTTPKVVPQFCFRAAPSPAVRY